MKEIRKKEIYKMVAKEMVAREDQSKAAMVAAMSNICIQLKKDGHSVGLWDANNAAKGVQNAIDNLKGCQTP